MKRSAKSKKAGSQISTNGITRITVAGYKSICKDQSIEIRPLTILAGANSSGKSSIMQPLLLLKQTLEATYDPGALLLNGPNIKFTSADQLLSTTDKQCNHHSFSVGIGLASSEFLLQFRFFPKKGFEVEKITLSWPEGKFSVYQGMTQEEINENLRNLQNPFLRNISGFKGSKTVVRIRCFLDIHWEDEKSYLGGTLFSSSEMLGSLIQSTTHLPGLRGNPERAYPVTAVGATFSGTFKNYVASLIEQWQEEKSNKLKELFKDLERLGLTWKVTAKKINDTQLELLVGRLPHPVRGGAQDLVNIADVGLGVSQTLPVLVALHAAKPEQLVYLEQPEIHLHPYAQVKMAAVLADAAKRGVRVVAETHSALLLLAVQTLVAEKKLSPDLVKLHWFERGKDGMTKITSADLDESGAFGEKWPEDFGDVELKAQSRYLDAIAARNKKISRVG